MTGPDRLAKGEMAKVAFTTFAILKEPYGGVKWYEDLTPPVFSAAEQFDGFVARAREIDDRPDLSNFERDWGVWGPFRAPPPFYEGHGGTTLATDTPASTVSLWRDLPSVYNFVYTGLHWQALAGRQQWFLKPEWLGHAMWWVDVDHTPTWSEASEGSSTGSTMAARRPPSTSAVRSRSMACLRTRPVS
jgi:hypothetical protein